MKRNRWRDATRNPVFWSCVVLWEFFVAITAPALRSPEYTLALVVATWAFAAAASGFLTARSRAAPDLGAGFMLMYGAAAIGMWPLAVAGSAGTRSGAYVDLAWMFATLFFGLAGLAALPYLLSRFALNVARPDRRAA